LDCCVVVGILFAAVKWYGLPWSDSYQALAAVSFGLSFVAFYSFDLYRSWRGSDFVREFATIVKGWGTVVGMVLFGLFFAKVSTRFSRVVLMAWFLATPIAVFCLHVAQRKLLRLLRSKGYNQKRAVLVGAGPLGERLCRNLEDMAWMGIRLVGVFDDKHPPNQPLLGRYPVLGKVAEVVPFLRDNPADYLFIALPLRAERKIANLVARCRSLGAQIHLVPDLTGLLMHNARLESLGGLMVLNFNPDPRHKRYFDIFFSLGVLFFTWPLFLLIAILIKLEDGGPVFYGHPRITAAGRRFRCLKFRTMCVNADTKLQDILERDPAAREEWERTFKLKNDPRITRVGKWLRKTSLDELPQFLNVLKGEMSVVGARPIVDRELCDYYRENGPLYVSMKPGITGPWQVSKRSDTEDYAERVALDVWYVLNRNLWLDIKIIFKTIFCMIHGKGAY
jgi:exopolysaccharide biosynthesis polyprenyl glycosylphosphotransferase